MGESRKYLTLYLVQHASEGYYKHLASIKEYVTVCFLGRHSCEAPGASAHCGVVVANAALRIDMSCALVCTNMYETFRKSPWSAPYGPLWLSSVVSAHVHYSKHWAGHTGVGVEIVPL